MVHSFVRIRHSTIFARPGELGISSVHLTCLDQMAWLKQQWNRWRRSSEQIYRQMVYLTEQAHSLDSNYLETLQEAQMEKALRLWYLVILSGTQSQCQERNSCQFTDTKLRANGLTTTRSHCQTKTDMGQTGSFHYSNPEHQSEFKILQPRSGTSLVSYSHSVKTLENIWWNQDTKSCAETENS